MNSPDKLPFKNCLEKDDRVIHAETKRPGTVAFTPKGRQTAVTWQGTVSAVYCDVMSLRLIPPNGKGVPEENPPIEGEPPALETATRRTPKPAAPAGSDALELAKAERAQITARMEAMNAEFKTLKARGEKLDQAIAILSA
jgi:hypothetical protein